MAPSTARSASRLWGGIRAVRRSLSVATPELGQGVLPLRCFSLLIRCAGESRFSDSVGRLEAACRSLFARDRDLQLCGHFRVQPDGDTELSQALDRLLEPDASTLDFEPVLAEELRHVGAPHRSEQAGLVRSLAALGKVQ